MSLTDTAIKKAKPSEKHVKLSDGKGLYLLANPVGSKLWRWQNRPSQARTRDRSAASVHSKPKQQSAPG